MNLNIRNLSPETGQRFRRQAGERLLTQAVYLGRVCQLVETMTRLARTESETEAPYGQLLRAHGLWPDGE